MSSQPLIVFMALTSVLALPGTGFQAPATPPAGTSIIDLLREGEVQRAEKLLDLQPASAASTALKGEIEFRKGNFAEAESLYRSALGRDSKTARAQFGLGKLALAKQKAKDAVKAFKAAIALDPKEPVYHLYASEAWGLDKNLNEQRMELETYVRLNPKDAERLAEAKAGIDMITAFKDQEIGAIEAPAKPAPIRLRKSLNLLFVDVMVDGQGPFNFVVDTGASQTVLSVALATKLGLKPVTNTVIHGIGGAGKVDTRIFRVGSIQVGDVKVKNLPVGTFDDPLLAQLADGIIGTATLADFVVTVNYPESRMELARTAAVVGVATEKIPAWCFGNLLLVSLQVNGQKGNFVVDTGAQATVLSHGMAAALGVTPETAGAKIDLPFGGVGGVEGVILHLPDVTLKTSRNSEKFDQVLAIDLKEISKMMETEVSGMIGFDFLTHYKLTIDYTNAEVRLEK
jgi:predicted aspartyl protease